MPSTVQIQYRSNNITTAAAFLVATGNRVLVGWNLITIGTTSSYLQLYNAAATTDVTVGTTAPIRTLLIPAGGTALLSNEDQFQLQFNLGIVGAVTGGMLDNSSAAPNGACMVEILYNSNS